MEVEARVQAMRFVMTWLSRLVRQRRRIREAAARPQAVDGPKVASSDRAQVAVDVRGG
jgi:hypothetical protein